MFQDNSEEESTPIIKQRFSRENFPPNLNKIQVTVLVETEIRPTEDIDSVLESLNNLFPEIEFTMQEERYFGRSNTLSSINYFSRRLLEQEILDAARRVILKRINKSTEINDEKSFVEFMVNKQTAKVKKIVFCEKEEAPLGPIIVKIISSDLTNIIDSYFPKYEWFKY
ncbi:MAG: RNA-binding domain-containing protein [Candidatus Hodarchaeales archaeon]